MCVLVQIGAEAIQHISADIDVMAHHFALPLQELCNMLTECAKGVSDVKDLVMVCSHPPFTQVRPTGTLYKHTQNLGCGAKHISGPCTTCK
jgi:hypothetical protein